MADAPSQWSDRIDMLTNPAAMITTLKAAVAALDDNLRLQYG